MPAAAVITACALATTVLVTGSCRQPGSGGPTSAAPGIRLSIYQGAAPVGTGGGEPRTVDAVVQKTIVVERRWVELKQGRSRVALDRVSGQLDVSTAWLNSLTDPDGVRVDGMVFEPGWHGERRTLDNWIGQQVDLTVRRSHLRTTLVDVGDDGIVIRAADGKRRVVPYSEIVSLGLGDAERRPTPRLYAEVSARRGGRHLIEFAYVTTGVTWTADHHVDVTEDASGALRAELASYATVVNESGTPFENAAVDLYAGALSSGATVRRVWRGTLSLARRQSSRVRLDTPASARPARIGYLYRGAVPDQAADDRGATFGTRSQGLVRERLLFDNPGVGSSGVMPPGRVRVRMRAGDDGDGRHLFSVLPTPVPRGSEVAIDLGAAPELRGERRQLSVRRSTDGTTVTERYRLDVENRRGEPVVVIVVEPLARSGRPTIVTAEPAGVRRGREVQFEFELAPGKRARADLEVVYHW